MIPPYSLHDCTDENLFAEDCIGWYVVQQDGRAVDGPFQMKDEAVAIRDELNDAHADACQRRRLRRKVLLRS